MKVLIVEDHPDGGTTLRISATMIAQTMEIETWIQWNLS